MTPTRPRLRALSKGMLSSRTLLLACAFLSVIVAGSDEGTAGQRVAGRLGTYSLELPPGWTALDPAENGPASAVDLVAVDPRSDAWLNVVIGGGLPSRIDHAYVDAHRRGMESQAHANGVTLTVVSADLQHIDGVGVARLVIDQRDAGIALRKIAVLIPVKNAFIALTGVDRRENFASFEPLFDHVLASFEGALPPPFRLTRTTWIGLALVAFGLLSYAIRRIVLWPQPAAG